MTACQNLAKKVGTFAAVVDISFEVPTASICAILGPNGAGKSTLVEMLTGLVAPTSGKAEVCGASARDPELKRMAGILPENLALFDALTIAEHLEFDCAVYKLSTHEMRMRRDQLLHL